MNSRKRQSETSENYRMRELIDALETDSKADWLIDTCFLFHTIDKGHTKRLIEFCRKNNVGMTSFNLAEVEHVHQHLSGTLNHHIRDFLKQKLIVQVPVPVMPGERMREKMFVSEYDPALLEKVRDASDAVLLVAALQAHANVLTRDKHHLFTTACENHVNGAGIAVLNEFPR